MFDKNKIFSQVSKQIHFFNCVQYRFWGHRKTDVTHLNFIINNQCYHSSLEPSSSEHQEVSAQNFNQLSKAFKQIVVNFNYPW